MISVIDGVNERVLRMVLLKLGLEKKNQNYYCG